MSGPKSKKRPFANGAAKHDADEDTSKPTAVFRPTQGRRHTLTVALPGSIVSNAQSLELKTTLVGQIARALAVFCVDEVVIFDDGQAGSRARTDGYSAAGRSADDTRYTGHADPVHFMAHVLSYLEAPPHLRRALFALHPNLRLAGALPSLDMPHHFRTGERGRWRDGVAVPDPDAPRPSPAKKQRRAGPGAGSASTAPELETSTLADVGWPQPVRLSMPAPLGTRVTLDMGAQQGGGSHGGSGPSGGGQRTVATPVAPAAPREVGGFYWGFAVRAAASLSAVYTECPFEGGYDVSVGTSERGVALGGLEREAPHAAKALRGYQHLVVFFGGLAGLEAAVAADEDLQQRGVHEAKDCFDAWVDVCPGQGSRTIRTEEAVWLGLMGLRPWVAARGEVGL